MGGRPQVRKKKKKRLLGGTVFIGSWEGGRGFRSLKYKKSSSVRGRKLSCHASEHEMGIG